MSYMMNGICNGCKYITTNGCINPNKCKYTFDVVSNTTGTTMIYDPIVGTSSKTFEVGYTKIVEVG